MKGVKEKGSSWFLLGFIVFVIVAFFVFSFFVGFVFRVPSLDILEPVFVEESLFTGFEKGSSPFSSVNFIMFGDSRCPYSSGMVNSVKSVYEYYKDDVNFVYKHFLIYEDSLKAAEAVECAFDQNLGWEFVFVLFENPDKHSVSDLRGYSSELGLDSALFDSCLDSGIKASVIEKDKNEAIIAGITGSPSFVIGGKKIVGFQTEAGLGLNIREAISR